MMDLLHATILSQPQCPINSVSSFLLFFSILMHPRSTFVNFLIMRLLPKLPGSDGHPHSTLPHRLIIINIRMSTQVPQLDPMTELTNSSIRQLRTTSRTLLHSRQRQIFEQILKNNPRTNFIHEEYYPILLYGVPSEFRRYIWPQMLPNYGNITANLYATLKDTVNIRVGVAEGRLKASDVEMYGSRTCGDQVMKVLSDVKREISGLEEVMRGEAGSEHKLFNVIGGLFLLRQDLKYKRQLVKIGALLLLEMNSQYRTFIAMVSLLTATPLYWFHTDYALGINTFVSDIRKSLKKHHRKLYDAIDDKGISLRSIFVQWVNSMLINVLEIDTLMAVWDLLFLKNSSIQVISQICLGVVLVRAHIFESSQPAIQIHKTMTQTKLSFQQEESLMQFLREQAMPPPLQ